MEDGEKAFHQWVEESKIVLPDSLIPYFKQLWKHFKTTLEKENIDIDSGSIPIGTLESPLNSTFALYSLAIETIIRYLSGSDQENSLRCHVSNVQTSPLFILACYFPSANCPFKE